MFLIIYKILNIKIIYNLNSYNDFLKFLENKYLFFNSKIFICIINLFLIITFYIMIVALSTLFNSQFNMPKSVVTLITLILCFKVFYKDDLKFIQVFSSLLIPILIFFILFLCFDSINFHQIHLSFSYNNFISAFFYGLLYFSYNSLLIIPILFKMNTKSKKSNFILSLLFSSIVLFLTLLINLLLLTFFSYVQDIELPILFICNFKNNIYTFFYFFIILSAILTTLFSSGYSFMINIKKENKKIILIIFLLFSFIFNYFSFSNLIDTFYPVFGLLGLFQIFLILSNKY